MKRILFVGLILFVIYSCNDDSSKAQYLIDKAIEVAGGENYNEFNLELDFRERHYRVKRDGGLYRFERHTPDSLGMIVDVVTNNGFERFVNDVPHKVADSMAFKYTNSINSVQYFALLPYGLNDLAVNKYYLGTSKIKGLDYHKVRITFSQEGGGKDYEDVFIYWINSESFKIDYLAYSYVTDGGGMRFREAYNERYIGGLRFVDYNNYKPLAEDTDLNELDRLYESGQLKLLSKIENLNISVNR